MSPLTDHLNRTGIIGIYLRISKVGLTRSRQNENDFSESSAITDYGREGGMNERAGLWG